MGLVSWTPDSEYEVLKCTHTLQEQEKIYEQGVAKFRKKVLSKKKINELDDNEWKILLELAAEGACIEQMRTLDKAKQIEEREALEKAKKIINPEQ